MFLKSRLRQNGQEAVQAELVSGSFRPEVRLPKEFSPSLNLRAVWFERSQGWLGLLTGALVFSLFFLVLFTIQFATPNLAGNDGYYHIKLAYLMRTTGLMPEFHWLPLTILNVRDFVDHHFLYHILLMPFTFGDLRIGAKLASVIFPALSFTLVWWVLRSQKVPYPALWALGLLVISEGFIYRMNMPRAQSLSLGMLVLALYLLLERKDRWLLPLGFLYVWLYNAFPLLLVVCLVYAVARWLDDRSLAWRPLLYAGLGITAGLVINPYFPENLFFIWHHISPKVSDPTAIRVGSEWYPYDTAQLLDNSGPALIAFISGAFALGLGRRRMGVNTATALFLAVFFGILLFQSRRFVEYFPPFALIFLAFAAAPLIKSFLEVPAFSIRPERKDQPLLWRFWHNPKPRSLLLPGVFLVLLLAFGWLTYPAATEDMLKTKPYRRYAAAAQWLEENSPPGSLVYQTDWDDFPRLYFYNSHNTYTVGLDPTYLQLADPDLYELWDDISKGREDDLSGLIANTFGGTFVFSDLKHEAFLEQAEEDSALAEVYRDEFGVIFQVKDGSS